MDKLILTFILLISYVQSNAQYAYFGTRGNIAFDKVTFNKARIKSMSQQMDPSMMMRFGGGGGFNIDNMPESTTQKLILHFDENATLLRVDPTTEEQKSASTGSSTRMGMGGGRGGNRGNQNRGGNMPRGRVDNNSKIFYQDLKKNTSSLQLEIDEKYIITDTLNNITWRFTDEYRDIAGFECRRVNGSTADSLYLVAFYTDQIPVSAGPALSSGLPGMILGLAIPEMHIQYWATKLDYTNDPIPSDWKDKKSTSITFDDFVKSFGRIFQRGRDSNSGRRQIQEQLIY
ncbi:GLPGLI family protein [Sphingobacterium bovistauri]|uniref:GLPGLI family protein n=1 Tax=Sphingobacterium bovistauri TaxID=2781959 RepID=A0ABS7Z4E4_9SPHI|nr:GLPGLI family protein [Sphingobacterium bovistauri]MCA5005063.1 GLPGLI family protein [Sphingobacterium bovistauri]